MNTNKKISFCCLSYNHSAFIEECIKSIWKQNYSNIEIIVLDDGSSDNSFEKLQKLKEISPFPMTIISQKNCGNIGANFNKLISKASGDYITFIACDDSFIENTIPEKIDILNKNENIVFVCDSKIRVVDENNNEIKNYPIMKLDNIKDPSAKDILKLDFNKIHSYYIQGTVYRKNIIDAVEGFDESCICDDIILRTKISRYIIKNRKLKLKVLHKESINYRRHSNNISENYKRQVISISQYYNKYWKKKRLPITFLKQLKIFIMNDHISKEEVLSLFEGKNLKVIDNFLNNRFDLKLLFFNLKNMFKTMFKKCK